MTLLPSESHRVVGVEGGVYELNDVCAVPGCRQAATERHHLWRRSALGGDFWRVAVYNGDLLEYEAPNCVGLCHEHHRQATDNEKWIKYEDSFRWMEKADEGESVALFVDGGPLDPQPGEQHKHAHEAVPGEPCPTCKRKVPEPFKGEARRKSATWSIRAPQDAGEDGIEVLKTLTEECAALLGRGGQPPYFVLAAALYFFVQNYQPGRDG